MLRLLVQTLHTSRHWHFNYGQKQSKLLSGEWQRAGMFFHYYLIHWESGGGRLAVGGRTDKDGDQDFIEAFINIYKFIVASISTDFQLQSYMAGRKQPEPGPNYRR